MALNDFIQNSYEKKIEITEERIKKLTPVFRQYIAFWREYPDLFLDFLQTGGDPNVKKGITLYFYQRLFLRAIMRYRYVYMTFPRAYSKSFLSVLAEMLRCILYPGAKIFVTSGGKEQSASILKDKVEEICRLVPALDNEIIRDRGGGGTISRDYVCYLFKGGSQLDNLTASEKTRGQRRHSGLMEECVGIDGQILQDVLIPVMNVSRPCASGERVDSEILNKSQIYVTTAGYKGTFGYDKLIQILVWMISEPEKAFVMGGTWKIPVLAGLIDKNFVKDMQRDGTFNEASFDREYNSIWSGTSENAYFRGEVFDRNRKIHLPEYEAQKATKNSFYYVLSVDVGRKGCQSVVCVWKVFPQSQGPSVKHLVNIITMEDAHFEDQAVKLKKLYYGYKARRLVIDGNGLGIGLIDYMVKPQIIPETEEYYPPFGVYNDEEGYYKQYRAEDTEDEAMYIIKAHAKENTEAHANVQTQLNAGKVKFLIDERSAKQKLLSTQLGQKMSDEKRAEYLKPFTLTSILKEELINLVEENQGVNIILKQANKRIPKDKVSAMEYGLLYIKLEEDDKRKKRKKIDIKQYLFMS